MKLTRATISLYLGLVFASGLALGVFGDRYYVDKATAEAKAKAPRRLSPDEWRRAYLNGMQKQLALSDDQVKKLSSIMDETKQLLDDLHKRHLPEQIDIQKAQGEKIRALFDDVQRQKYDEMMKRMAERSKLGKNKSNTPAPPTKLNP